MSKSNQYCARLIKTIENGVTIISIIGLENSPKAYKSMYLLLVNEIKQNMLKIISKGESVPVIRVYPSLEIH